MPKATQPEGGIVVHTARLKGPQAHSGTHCGNSSSHPAISALQGGGRGLRPLDLHPSTLEAQRLLARWGEFQDRTPLHLPPGLYIGVTPRVKGEGSGAGLLPLPSPRTDARRPQGQPHLAICPPSVSHSAHPRSVATGLPLTASVLVCTAVKGSVGQTGRATTQPYLPQLTTTGIVKCNNCY